MSRRRVYTDDCLRIQERFFLEFERLRSEGKISVKSFCQKLNISTSNFYAQKNDFGRGYFEVGWLVILIRDFGIDAHWLMIGE
jgi:hypothetical protein